MKEKDRLDILFDQALSGEPIVNQDHIDELVRSGKQVSAKKIKLGKAGRGLFNPLNLIIMISTVAIIVTSLFFVFNGTHDVVPSVNIQQSSGEISVTNDLIPERSSVSSPQSSKESLEESKHLIGTPNQPLLNEEGVKENIADLSDTLIIGEVLYLTQEELTRLGFLFNENGFFYLNETEHGYMSFYSDKYPDDTAKDKYSGFGMNKKPFNQRKEITNFSFYPGFYTGTAGEHLEFYDLDRYSIVFNSENFQDDILVPVYFPGRWFVDDHTSDRLVWFHVTDEFFDLLPAEKVEATKRRIDLVKRLREISGNETKNFVDYKLPGNISKNINPIKLSRSSLGKLGLNVSIKGVNYRYQFENSYALLDLSDGGSKFRSSANAIPEDMKYDRIYNTPLLGTTCLNGENSVGISVEFYPGISDTVDFLSNMHDVCVPVRFVDDSLPEVVKNTIFWYFPTEEFFKSLPDSIGIPMAREYDVNVVPKLRSTDLDIVPIIIGVRARDEKQKSEPAEAVPCEYFPSFCEGLPGLDNLNVYPNPATDIINVEVIISRGKSIDFRVFDITGRLMIDDVETKDYPDAGMYKQKIDVSSLTEGFYLLVLTDEEGAKMTRRIIKN